MKKITAYKILNHDYTCRGFKYEIGKTYRLEDENGKLIEPELCDRGFHACAKLEQCFKYYSAAGWNHFVEVELSGKIKGNEKDKYCSNIITIVKEIELRDLSYNVRGASNVRGAHGVRGAHDVSGASSVHGAYNVSGASDVHGASHVSGASDVHGASHVSGASYVHGAYNVSGASYVHGAHDVYGAYDCMLICKCKAVTNCILCYDIESKANYVFNKKITEERIIKIKKDLAQFDYYPKFNNYFDLLKENSEMAEKVPANLIKSKSIADAYADMPQDMIDYIKSMPEYDEKIFNKITKGE